MLVRKCTPWRCPPTGSGAVQASRLGFLKKYKIDGYQRVSHTSRMTLIFEIRANWINSFSKNQKIWKSINFPKSYGSPKLTANPKIPLGGPRFIAICQGNHHKTVLWRQCNHQLIWYNFSRLISFCGTPF